MNFLTISHRVVAAKKTPCKRITAFVQKFHQTVTKQVSGVGFQVAGKPDTCNLKPVTQKKGLGSRAYWHEPSPLELDDFRKF